MWTDTHKTDIVYRNNLLSWVWQRELSEQRQLPMAYRGAFGQRKSTRIAYVAIKKINLTNKISHYQVYKLQIVTGVEVTTGSCFPDVWEILPDAEVWLSFHHSNYVLSTLL